MQIFKTLEHLGLKTALPQPPGNSAKAMQNFVRHPHNGWLEQADGYGLKLTLPVSDTYNTLISVKDIHNFYVKEHGGKQITIVVGTYSKKYRFSGTLIPRTGVWIYPYYDGGWQNAWRELTEIEVVDFASWDGVNIVLGADYGFPDNYFKNWIVTFEGYSSGESHDNYLLCTGYTKSTKKIATFSDGTTIPALRPSPTKIILSRSWMNGETPSSLNSFIFSLFNEVRMTTGNSSSDINMMAGFRTKNFGWATSDYNMDQIFAERACLSIYPYAFGIKGAEPVNNNDSALPSDVYQLKCTLVLDDGNETELRNPSSEQLSPLTPSVSFAVPGVYGDSIASDGLSFYVSTLATASLYKVNPLTNKVEIGLTFTATDYVTGANSIQSCVYNGFLYVCTTNTVTNKFKIAQVDLITLTVKTTTAEIYIGAVSTVKKIIAFNGYVYVLSNGLTNVVLKYDASSLAGVNVFTLPYGINGASVIIPFGIDILIGYDSVNPKVEQVNVDTFAIIKTVTMTGYNNLSSMATIDSSTVYVGATYSVDTRLVKINMPSQSITSFALILGGAAVYVRDIIYDGSQYLGVVYGSTSAAVVRINPSSMTSVGNILVVDASYTSLGTVFLYNAYHILSAIYGSVVYSIDTKSYSSLNLNGAQAIRFKPIISASTLLRRAKKLRIYINKSGSDLYYAIKDVNLMATDASGTAIAWDSAPYYDTYMLHFYHQGEYIYITLDDWNVTGALATANIGRSVSDTGMINYLNGTVVGTKSYAVSPYIGTPPVNEINKVVVCGVNGSGGIQNDVFPNDVANVINLEYSDDDQIVVGLPLADRLLVLKKKSIVLLTNNGGDYLRDQVSQGVGCCSARSARSFEDTNYFADYNGIYSYSTGSLKLLNTDWVLDWKALLTADKEASIGIIDIANRKYILNVATTQYVLDIDSGEWMVYLWNDQPFQFAQNSPDATNPGNVDFLTASKIENLAKAKLQDGNNFTMSWESNEINPLAGKEGYAYDTLLQHLVFDYESGVAITASIYLDGSSTALQTYTLSASNKKTTVLTPLSTKCKTFRVKYSATTAGVSQKVKIKARMDYFDIIPSGGDIMVI